MDWEPGVQLKATFQELWDTKEWLAAILVASVSQAPPDVLGKKWGESGMGDGAGQVVMPKRTNRQQDHNQEESEVGDDVNLAGTPSNVNRKQGLKVAQVDQVKHVLSGRLWEGLGTVCKGADICVNLGVWSGAGDANE